MPNWGMTDPNPTEGADKHLWGLAVPVAEGGGGGPAIPTTGQLWPRFS